MARTAALPDAALRALVRMLCRHDDSAWTPTAVPGLDVQEVAHEGARLIVVRQRVLERPHAGGKQLSEAPGCKFQVLRTNLPVSVSALEAWRRYNGRADIENRIKELGAQFGLKDLCCRSFWATEAACHLAICAYKPLRRTPAPARPDPTRRTDHPALAVVLLRGRVQPHRRQAHPQTRRRHR